MSYLGQEIEQRIRQLIVKIPNFPIPQYAFTDITPLLERDPVAFRTLLVQMCSVHRLRPPDVILCIESSGYLFGAPMSYELGSRIVLARRSGKLPRPTLHQAYAMGYDHHRHMEIQKGALSPTSRVLIVDDVLATGGTALAALDLAEQAGATVCGVSVAVELEGRGGRHRLTQRGVEVYAGVCL